ncbi:MAG: ribonuclease H-like domain-containing protein [Chitinophagaceae bacterium]
MKLENLLLIDIETVPSVASYHDMSLSMQKLWDKKAHLINYANNEIDTASEFAQKGGIYAEFGKIICIGLGYFIKKGSSYHLKIKSIYGDEEKAILNEFALVCNKFFKTSEKQFCGHNIREFDIPYICRRSVINQIKMPEVLADLQHKKPWENPMLDTLQYWKFGEYKSFISVDLLSTVLGIDSPKEDIDGSQVAQVYWQEKNLERIKTYCNRDIETVAQILMRLHEWPLIPKENIENV